MPGPTKDFWEQRFATGTTPWDRGAANPQLGAWLAAGALKPCRILIPGCGSGHEAAVLAQAGFDVTALDYAHIAIERTRTLLAARRLKATLVEADALIWRPDSPFDAIYEQTCLCALYPDPLWTWPKPPYPRTSHPAGLAELAAVLTRAGR